MTTTIVSDLSEVLLTGILGIEETIAWAIERDQALVKQQLKGEHLTEYFHGRLTEKELWYQLITTHGWRVSVPYLMQVARMNFREIPGTRRVLDELRRQGYRLGLLSIHGLEWIEFCRDRFRHEDPFDQVSYSFQTRVSKPDPAAYRAILGQLQAEPEQTVFIDDQFDNVEAARQLGMAGIVFTSPSQLKQELIRMGVLANGRGR